MEIREEMVAILHSLQISNSLTFPYLITAYRLNCSWILYYANVIVEYLLRNKSTLHIDLSRGLLSLESVSIDTVYPTDVR